MNSMVRRGSLLGKARRGLASLHGIGEGGALPPEWQLSSVRRCVLADLLGTDLIKKLIHSMLAFLSSHNREVVMSTLVLLKVVIGILPADDLAPHVEGMVSTVRVPVLVL